MPPSPWHREALSPWVDRIVSSALRVLAERGMRVPQAELRSALSECDGVTVVGESVRFGEATAFGFLTRYRACHPFAPPERITVGAGGHAHHIVDLQGELRPIRLADIEWGARLIGTLEPDGMIGVAPGIPQDVPPPLQGLAQIIATAKGKAGYAWCAFCAPEAEPYRQECCAVLGQEPSVGVHLVSPLRFEGQEVESALEARRRAPDCPIGLGSMPVIGVSTPGTALSAFVVAMAEVLGGGLVLALTGTPVERLSLWVNAYPFDMRQGCFVYGTPANVVCSLLERELNRHLGTEAGAKSFSVMAQRPGPHACALKGLFTGLMVSQGRRIFTGAGVLSLDEVYSPLQLMYDRETVRYIRHAEGALEASLDESLLLADEVIAATDDDFLGAESTARNYRLLQWDSPIFASRMLAQWEAAGRPEAEANALAEIDRLLAAYDYELDADKAHALDEVYSRARERLG